MGFTADITTGLCWLIEHLPHEPVPTDPSMRAMTMRLANPYAPSDLDAAINGGAGPAWLGRRTALSAYRQVLAAQRDPLTVLPSLLHLHHVRMFGIDPARERLSRHLARAVALRWASTGSHR